jgi:hypothetical protein
MVAAAAPQGIGALTEIAARKPGSGRVEIDRLGAACRK